MKKEAFNLRFQQATGQMENAQVRMRKSPRCARVKYNLKPKSGRRRRRGVSPMPKRILSGVVTSNQNEQTVTVSVERRFTSTLC